MVTHLHPVQSEIVRVCHKVLPRVSVQAPPLLICRVKQWQAFPGGGGSSQGQGPTCEKVMDIQQMMRLAGGLGLSSAISYAEATFAKSVSAYPESPCKQALNSQMGLNASI